jgi:predicted aspartyl protease
VSAPFDPNARRVLVPVTVRGPRATHRFGFALDTGASRTTLRPELLRLLGFDLANPVAVRDFRGVTGGGRAPSFVAEAVTALGVTLTRFEIHAVSPSASVTIDGLLGLDFLRGRVLTLDFARGRMALRRPRWWAFWR